MSDTRYLLDTNCLIWFQENSSKIPGSILSIIQKPDNIILFSQISLFEIAIKQKIGKLPAFYTTIDEIYRQAVFEGFTFLNIQNQHLYSYDKVPLIENHRDPFDRLLIATAIAEDAVILSADEKFKLYAHQIKVLW